jgi:hypothetical protein
MKIIHHTWYNKHAHIFRTDGRVVRAVLKQLVVEDNAIYIQVSFLDKGRTTKTKLTSPITVAALQIMWMNVDVVSDVDVPDGIDGDMDTFVPPPECDRLPPLEIRGVQITSEMKCLLVQINHFLRLASTTSPAIMDLDMTPRSPPIKPTPRRHHRTPTTTTTPKSKRVSRHRTVQDNYVAPRGP